MNAPLKVTLPDGTSIECDDMGTLANILQMASGWTFPPPQSTPAPAAPPANKGKKVASGKHFVVTDYKVLDREGKPSPTGYAYFSVTPSLQGQGTIRKAFKDAIREMKHHAFWSNQYGCWGINYPMTQADIQAVLA